MHHYKPVHFTHHSDQNNCAKARSSTRRSHVRPYVVRSRWYEPNVACTVSLFSIASDHQCCLYRHWGLGDKSPWSRILIRRRCCGPGIYIPPLRLYSVSSTVVQIYHHGSTTGITTWSLYAVRTNWSWRDTSRCSRTSLSQCGQPQTIVTGLFHMLPHDFVLYRA